MHICDLSRVIHDAIWSGPSQSLCARAYEHRDHLGWACWVVIFGRRHCKASWLYYRRQRGKRDLDPWDVW